MRVLLVQQLAWGIQIGHDLAKAWKRNGHSVSAIVLGSATNRFLERQGKGVYDHHLLIDPVYDEGTGKVSETKIREIESRYGIDSIWRLICSDRLLIYSWQDSRRFTHRTPKQNSYLLSVCVRLCETISELLDTVKPDYIVAPNIGYAFSYIMYMEAKCRNIPVYTLTYADFGKYLFVGDDEFMQGKHIRNRYEELAEKPEMSLKYEEAKQIYDRLHRHDEDLKLSYGSQRRVGAGLPRFISAAAELARKLPLGLARTVEQVFKGPRTLDIRNIWLPNNSRANAIRNAWRGVKEGFVKADRQGVCYRDMAEVDFRYVFYPLQFEPELDLMVWTPEFANQLELCRRIAMALPGGARLLVKEHPSMVPARKKSFYEKIKGLPNVELAHSSVAPYDIFTNRNCQATVALSTSVGFEAAICGCPVVLLGPAGYGMLSGVHRVATVEEACSLVRDICSNGRVAGDEKHQRACIGFICALLENCFSSEYHRKWNVGSGDAKPEEIVKAIEHRFHEAHVSEA